LRIKEWRNKMPGKNPEAPRVKTLASAGTEFRAEDAT
jgi:hypothetical protein